MLRLNCTAQMKPPPGTQLNSTMGRSRREFSRGEFGRWRLHHFPSSGLPRSELVSGTSQCSVTPLGSPAGSQQLKTATSSGFTTQERSTEWIEALQCLSKGAYMSRTNSPTTLEKVVIAQRPRLRKQASHSCTFIKVVLRFAPSPPCLAAESKHLFPYPTPMKTFKVKYQIWRVQANSQAEAEAKVRRLIRDNISDLVSTEPVEARAAWKILLFG